MNLDTDMLKLKHPFTFCVVGPTGSGKTVFVKNLLIIHSQIIDPSPQKIYYFYSIWQPMYTEMLNDNHQIEFIQGYNGEIEQFVHTDINLMILDDLMEESKNDPEIAKIFTKASHHKNTSIIFLSQNLFLQGKHTRTISINSHYIAIFKNPRDKTQFSYLARQMFPGVTKFLNESYQDATGLAHGYLFLDFKQNTPDNLRVRSNILDRYPFFYIKK